MIIAHYPRNKPFPVGSTILERIKILAKGRVTVGEFCRENIKTNKLETYYLPRIAARTVIPKDCEEYSFSTPEAAYQEGKKTLEWFKWLAKKYARSIRRKFENICSYWR